MTALNETLAFVLVVRSGSFTAAGRQLGVPKSTLSRQVARLEERLGARLLQRTTRKLSPTETGAAYYERCREAIEAIEEAERVAQDVSARARGTLRVSATIGVEQNSPILTPGVQNPAASEATARSQLATSWQPAAVAGPCTAAMTGCGRRTIDIMSELQASISWAK